MSLLGGVELPPRFSVTHELSHVTDSVSISVEYTTRMDGNLSMDSIVDGGQDAIDNMIAELLAGLVSQVFLEMQALGEGI